MELGTLQTLLTTLVTEMRGMRRELAGSGVVALGNRLASLEGALNALPATMSKVVDQALREHDAEIAET